MEINLDDVDRNHWLDIRVHTAFNGKRIYAFKENDDDFIDTEENTQSIYDFSYKFFSSNTTELYIFFNLIFNFLKENIEEFDIEINELIELASNKNAKYENEDDLFYCLDDDLVGDFIHKVNDELTIDYRKLTYGNNQTFDFLKNLDDIKGYIMFPRKLAHAVTKNYVQTHFIHFLRMVAYEKKEGSKFDFIHHLSSMFVAEVKSADA
jgi:hypothetical protein